MSEIYKCTPRQARRFITDIVTAGLVPFVQSSPGIGKSSIMANIAKELSLKLIDHRLSTSAPEDLSGLPEFYTDPAGNRHARFVPFAELFPLDTQVVPQGYDGWMLFLDEFNSASKSVQAASYKLILDRMVGQRKLNPNMVITAAGNLAGDRAITNSLSTAMQSRVIHLEMTVNFTEWLYDVALAEQYDSRIVGYLSQFESKLMDFNPSHSEKTFCCPRTWSFVNALIKDKPVTDDHAMLLAGTITSGTAADFVQFCKIYTKLITIDRVLANPELCELPDTQNLRWATVSHLMEKVNESNFEKLSLYVDRMDMSFRILFYRSTLVRQPALRGTPAFIKAMVALSKYLHG